MKMNERIIWAFIVAVLLFCLVKCRKDIGLVKVLTETVRRDTIKESTQFVYVPKPYQVIIHDTLLETVAVEILKKPTTEYKSPAVVQFIPTNLYKDTLQFGDNGYAVLEDSIQGKILQRKMNYSITQTTIIKESIREAPKKVKFYAGAEYFYPLNYTGLALGVQLKNDNFLKGSFGYVNGRPQYGISYYTKIRFK